MKKEALGTPGNCQLCEAEIACGGVRAGTEGVLCPFLHCPRRSLSGLKPNSCPGPGSPGQPRRDGLNPGDWSSEGRREHLSEGSARWRPESERQLSRQQRRGRHAESESSDTPTSCPLSLEGQMLPSSQPDLCSEGRREEGRRNGQQGEGAAGSLVNTPSHLPSREPPR